MRARPARRIVCCAAKWREVAACVLLICTGVVHADERFGKVITIADGDTLTIVVGKEAHRVRLAGIDAPEKKQPFGNRSKRNRARRACRENARADCRIVGSS
jgi:endonuclease YncB( thermonuclease family)